MIKQACEDCGVVRNVSRKNTLYCVKCKPKHAVRTEGHKRNLSEALQDFWDLRTFDELGRRAKKQRVIEEQNGKCLECEQNQMWNGKFLDLQLDHISGNNKDNRRQNLRALCPNCHTQTPTFGSRGVDEETKKRIIAGAKNGAKVRLERYFPQEL